MGGWWLVCTSPPPKIITSRSSSVYRILKAFDLITSPAFVLVKAEDFNIRPSGSTSFGKRISASSRSSVGAMTTSSLDRTGRLFPLHHRLETHYRHEPHRCAGHARPCLGRHRGHAGSCQASSALVERQRFRLHLSGPGRVFSPVSHPADPPVRPIIRKPRAKLSAITGRLKT